jgi:hypothetical protein
MSEADIGTEMLVRQNGTKKYLFSLMVSPCEGVFLDNNPAAGGHIRDPSLIIACKYGNLLASSFEMIAFCPVVRKLVSISDCIAA